MHQLPKRGIWTDQPASKWEDALVSGNGSHGVMVFGDPVHDTVIGNHCRLYLPQGNSYDLPDMAPYLEEMRKIIREQGYEKAISFYYQKAKELGYQGLTMSDPSHPGFHMHIETDHQKYTDYKRSINYETGELSVSYKVNEQSYVRRTFVSQDCNQIIHYLSPGNYTIKLTDYQDPKMSQTSMMDQQTIHTHFDYRYSEAGYDVLVDVIAEGVKPLSKAVGFEINSEKSVQIRMEIVPYKEKSERKIIKQSLSSSEDYPTLFAKHVSIHQEMFERVELTLATDQERQQQIWSLVEQAKQQGKITPVLLEKMYDAGRYMYICSAGELTPNLQGIWTGTFDPPWSGDFTFDTNVELSIAAALSSNLLEGLEGYFGLIKELMPGFRENAQKYYGARGVMAAIHSSNCGKHVHWNQEWPLHLWTCGAGWLAHWYYQYYRFTGDKLFLQHEVVPFLEDIVLFYEDFLIEDTDGPYRFTPSYSAENGAADNATQDIAVANEVLTNLSEAYQILGYPQEKVKKCREMRSKMPAYQVNEDGALKEWLTSEKGENYNHRHFSHLYPVFQSREFNNETDPEMWQAARTAFDKRLEAWLLNEDGDTTSTHGRMHSALCATQFHRHDLIEDIFRLLIDHNCFYSSLMMSHYNEQNVFNVDGNGALPQVVHEMLADFSNGRLTLLGAIPSSLPKGEITGIRLPNQMIINRLKWDTEAKHLELQIISQIDQEVKLYFPLYPEVEEHHQRISLQQNKQVSFVINL
ncbi:Glycosyl hydrolase family 65, N-terminal domain [Gracilibacillus orientalis]|uniref:Glycosyl hydrolase family 65, N-terminal domain n=1 Tax=Gracilibacillus orientalis TaxID=334253 RepID=A0A1I4IEC1_9BACI|nr:glycoside hydrolase N-terminal domain-containing protein [Gracilibacillus orientalis]SFL52131.1 Glycosyl hydrolase family 65, N-terminal domain [Gracilibacillus orientalis]